MWGDAPIMMKMAERRAAQSMWCSAARVISMMHGECKYKKRFDNGERF